MVETKKRVEQLRLGLRKLELLPFRDWLLFFVRGLAPRMLGLYVADHASKNRQNWRGGVFVLQLEGVGQRDLA